MVWRPASNAAEGPCKAPRQDWPAHASRRHCPDNGAKVNKTGGWDNHSFRRTQPACNCSQPSANLASCFVLEEAQNTTSSDLQVELLIVPATNIANFRHSSNLLIFRLLRASSPAHSHHTFLSHSSLSNDTSLSLAPLATLNTTSQLLPRHLPFVWFCLLTLYCHSILTN